MWQHLQASCEGPPAKLADIGALRKHERGAAMSAAADQHKVLCAAAKTDLSGTLRFALTGNAYPPRDKNYKKQQAQMQRPPEGERRSEGTEQLASAPVQRSLAR